MGGLFSLKKAFHGGTNLFGQKKKNGAEKGFIFHAIIPALHPFWSKYYWLS